MKGLDLAEEFFRGAGLPMLKEKYASCLDRIAAGAVGPGSEHYGFDDELSRDHDWGPGFCLWLTNGDYETIGPSLIRDYEALPARFSGEEFRRILPGEENKRGVFPVSGFYRRYIGMERPPASSAEWMRIREESLSLAVNGRVFLDPLGEFSEFRRSLLAYYPEEVMKKRLSSCLFLAAQAGQYNYPKSMTRGEKVAAAHSLSMFIHNALKIVHILNKRYAPYYKWIHRSARDLPVLGRRLYDCTETMAESPDRRMEGIGMVSRLIADEVRQRGLSSASGDFLQDHGFSVHESISDAYLTERLPFLYTP